MDMVWFKEISGLF